VLAFNEESFGAVTGYSYRRLHQLDGHVCFCLA